MPVLYSIKVSSERKFLNCNTWKNQPKVYFQCKLLQNMHYCSKREKSVLNEEILSKGRQKPWKTNYKSFSSMSDVKKLRCLCHSIFVDYNVLFSLASFSPCMQLSSTNTPWLSNAAWVSLAQLHALASRGLLLSWSSHTDSPAIYFLSSGALWSHGERVHDPLAFMILKPELCGWHCWVQLPAWDEPWPIWITSALAFDCSRVSRAVNALCSLSGVRR